MATHKDSTQFPSELRFDLISRDWVVIATGRAKKPHLFKSKQLHFETPRASCPFCNLETQEKPSLVINHGEQVNHELELPDDWTTVVIPNKFPAFLPHPELEPRSEGEFYQAMNAVGFHELVITKDHVKPLALLPLQQVEEVFEAYQLRYIALMEKKFVNHISIFHNHGEKAGASISHPHSQIVTTPLVDMDLKKALLTSKKYLKSKGRCAYCSMNAWELKVKKRLVFENREFLVICPFASKSAFEMIVSPKRHLPYFEQITESQRKYLAEAFQAALAKMHKGLNDPAHNFYLHTSPADGKDYHYYHWHWTILPKTQTWAGFEIGTRMEISTIEPERAAEYLRQQELKI